MINWEELTGVMKPVRVPVTVSPARCRRDRKEQRAPSRASVEDGSKAFKMCVPFDLAMPVPQLLSGKQLCRKGDVYYLCDKGENFFKKMAFFMVRYHIYKHFCMCQVFFFICLN